MLRSMSSVTEIIAAVKCLNETDKSIFLDRLREVDFEDEWDIQMQRDAKAGKLDFLLKEADEAARGEALRDWPGKSQ